ncbi:unnamed protein product [Toxocara canis]|uniref:WGR domain-containing protein n=1 Tax=Toxocara canis TaxID=6265 RepID=A0A183U247_TOXCA|nr:unnamed protein product [Toxocara canis]
MVYKIVWDGGRVRSYGKVTNLKSAPACFRFVLQKFDVREGFVTRRIEWSLIVMIILITLIRLALAAFSNRASRLGSNSSGPVHAASTADQTSSPSGRPTSFFAYLEASFG